MKLRNRLVTVGPVAVFVIVLTMLVLLEACKNRKDEAQQQSEVNKEPAQVLVENGDPVLTLDVASQDHLGLEITTLSFTTGRAQFTSPALVLSIQDLAAFRANYVAARAQLEKSRSQADVARREYTRLKTLFEQNQNISEKSLQSAEGMLETNEADARAAEQQVSLQEAVAMQDWGSVAAKWAIEGSPEFQRILDQRDMLVQITLPSNADFEAPKNISLELAGKADARASLISVFPRVDPRIQGKSFLYRTPAQPGFAPGISLVAHLPVGNLTRGVIVPLSAVLWSEGRTWVYQQMAPNRFVRRAVATDIPIDQGFFVAQGLSAGDKVVTRGAQALLSAEALARGQAGNASDQD
ncbi:MAG TPA: hypothetical protein VK699_14870 [Terriglobales bacterium]|jgi:hypothetical protein|nr:hypothetical protein [Terriglobales bacterium]